jgi:hypothetical protein
MISANVDITVRITEPFYIEAAFSTVGEDGVNTGPIDFSDADLRMQVRSYPDAATVILELTIENGRLIAMTPGSGDNDVNLVISVEQSAIKGIATGRYRYDLRYWDGPVLMEGIICFAQGVTR